MTWRTWRSDGVMMVAPTLIRYELTNALYRSYRFANVSMETIEAAMTAIDSLPIEYQSESIDHRVALRFATRFNLRAAYDPHYLALAERLGIEFWTVDERLYISVRHHLPWVHLVGAASED